MNVRTMPELGVLPVGTTLTDVTGLPVVKVAERIYAVHCDLGGGLRWNHFEPGELESPEASWFPMEVDLLGSYPEAEGNVLMVSPEDGDGETWFYEVSLNGETWDGRAPTREEAEEEAGELLVRLAAFQEREGPLPS